MTCRPCARFAMRTKTNHYQQTTVAVLNRQITPDDAAWQQSSGTWRWNFIISTAEQSKPYEKSFGGLPILCACSGTGFQNANAGLGVIWGEDKADVEATAKKHDLKDYNEVLVICRKKVAPFTIQGPKKTTFLPNETLGHALATSSKPYGTISLTTKKVSKVKTTTETVATERATATTKTAAKVKAVETPKTATKGS